MARHRRGNIQDRGTSFRIRYHDADGIRHQESYKTRDEAETQLAIRLGELAKGIPVSSRPNTVLFGELADDVLTDYEINGYRSLDDLEARFRLHIIPAFGRRKASQVTTAQIRKYALLRQKAGASHGTINRELEAIRHVFLFAKKGGKLFTFPHVPMLREDNVRTGFFTREEVEKLASFLSKPLAAMVRFAFLTGWRLGEIRSLEWRNVDFDAGEIRLDAGKTKNGKGRVFPMSSDLRSLLESLAWTGSAAPKVVRVKRVAAITPHVFTIKGKPIGDFRKSWKTACYKAGIPCVVEPVRKGGKKGAVKVIDCTRTFHDLRRSAAKNLIAQGIPERVVMQICGWLSRSVFDRYSVVGEADLRIARERMDGGIGPAKGPIAPKAVSKTAGTQ